VATPFAASASLATSFETRAVAPGEVICTSANTDLAFTQPRWRLYGIGAMRLALLGAVRERGIDASVIEDALRATSWGALSVATDHFYPNSIPLEAARVRSVLAFSEELSTLRFLGPRKATVETFDDLLEETYEGLLQTWAPGGTGPVAPRLTAAVDAMESASADEVTEALVGRMVHLARRDPRLRENARLNDPGFLRGRLQTMDPEMRIDLEAGFSGSLIGVLYDSLRSDQ
jgi:hypothetical protein